MPGCAVFGCGNHNRKTKSTEIKYFRFPKTDLSKQWIIACKREDPINLKTACICSVHFDAACFQVPLKQRLLNYKPKNCRNLKADAIPTLNLPGRNSAVSEDRANRYRQRSFKQEASTIVKNLLSEINAVAVAEKSEVLLPKINDTTEEDPINLQYQSHINKKLPSVINKINNQHEMALQTEVFNEQDFFNCANQVDKYKCKTCSSFQTNFLVSLKAHIRDGHLNNNSEVETVDIFNWFNWGHRPYKCKENDNSLSYTQSLHIESEDSNQWFECGQSYSNFKRSRTSENRPRTCDTESDDIRRFHCPYCPYTFRDERNLKNHVKYRHCKSEDIQGTSEFETNRFLKYHNSYPEDVHIYLCEHCPSTFNTRSNWRRHVITRHESIRRFECELCSIKFTAKSSLKNHIKYRHSNPEEIQWFECDQCPSRFTTRKNLNRHVIARHTESEDIPWHHCPHCSHKCKESGHLKTHIRNRHAKPEDIQWFECEQCSSKFKTKNHMKYHLRAAHSRPEGIQWLKCEQCPSKFKSKKGLQQHAESHLCNPEDVSTQTEDIQLWQCKECPSKFKSKNGLKYHVESQHGNPEDIQWFHCPQCPHKSKDKGNLNRHITYRHGKPDEIQMFECEQCTSKFKAKSLLTRHVKLCHPRPEDIQWFECQQCSFKFKSKQNWKKHACHTRPEDVLWLECEQCASKFKSRNSLQKHVEYYHNSVLDQSGSRTQCAAENSE